MKAEKGLTAPKAEKVKKPRTKKVTAPAAIETVTAPVVTTPAPATIGGLKERIAVTDEMITGWVEAGTLVDRKTGSKVVDVAVKKFGERDYYSCKLENGKVRSWYPELVLTKAEVKA